MVAKRITVSQVVRHNILGCQVSGQLQGSQQGAGCWITHANVESRRASWGWEGGTGALL
jgi:hypothetical protein